MFKEFFMIFSLIIVHEIGHLSLGLYFKWNIKNITIYPFGGCIKFDDKINRPIKEEFLILIFGPIFQIIFFLIIYILFLNGFISYRNINIMKSYNLALLIFNLLPIYPLDGGMLVNLLLQEKISYRKSNKIAIVISFITIILALCIYKNINFLLMSILIIFELLLYIKRQSYLYNKFLLERYINKIRFKKYKTINNKNNFYRDKTHVILFNNKYITEKDYLEKRYEE